MSIIKKYYEMFFPVVYGIFPVLFLYAHNIDFFPIRVLWRPLFLVLIFSLGVCLLFRSTFQKEYKGNVFSSIILFALFSYGTLRTLLPANIHSDIYFFVIWLFFVALILWVVLFLIKSLKPVKSTLLNISIMLLILPLLSVIFYSRGNKEINRTERKPAEYKEEFLASPESPNIYYIILDAYGRSDVLKNLYGFDNSSFIDELKKMGFYVAEESHSNYVTTLLSLPSSLNMNYLDQVLDIDPNSSNKQSAYSLINESEFFTTMKSMGYAYKPISGWFYANEVDNTSVFFSSSQKIGEFENQVLRLTPIPTLLTLLSLSESSRMVEVHRNVTLQAFEQLHNVTEVSEPTVAFVHFIAPHSPFVFDKDGGYLPENNSMGGWDGNHLVGVDGFTRKDYIDLYARQAEFITNKTLESIRYILKYSKKPPIIILQSDHGPGAGLDWENLEKTDVFERFSILNAYYFPNSDYSQLYPSITPVNSFRVVMNAFFSGQFEILPDRSYYSTYTRPYKFIDITNRLKDAED